MLDEHFVKEEGKYKVKAGSDNEQLKALNFNEIHLIDGFSEQDVGVVLTADEASAIVVLGKRLLERWNPSRRSRNASYSLLTI